MSKSAIGVTAFLAALALASAPAQAYIGPGAGAGTIAVVLGILASVFIAFFALLWYPLKRVVRKVRGARPAAQTLEGTNNPPHRKDAGTAQQR